MAKQNHQPFSAWLHSEEPLAPEQRRQLQEHLRECESCRQIQTAWGEVRSLIKATPRVSPATGFTARWQARLEQARRQEEQRQRRLGLVLLGITGGIAAILFLLLLTGAAGVFDDPVQYLFLIAYRIVYLFTYAISLRDFIVEFLRPALAGVSPLLYVLIPGVITLVCVLWVVAIRTLTTSRRFINENE
jgi:hypothetical protein